MESYPVLRKEFSMSRVITKDEDDMVIYDTRTGTTAHLNAAAFEFAKRCRGNKTLREIISELSRIAGEPPQKIEENLSKFLKKMDDNGMLVYTHSPEQVRPEPCEVNLYSRIENVSFEITRQCNLRCKHCYSNSGVKRDKELTVKEIKKLIDQLANIGVLNVMLTGGEPLLHPHFFDVLTYIRSKPMSCVIFSNGTLITQEVVDTLAEIGVLSVNISVDGAVPETHDAFRGVQGSFEKAVNAITMLREADIAVRCNTSLHKGNIGEFVEITTLLEELGVENSRVYPISYSGRPEKSDIFVTPEEYRRALKRLNQHLVQQGKEVRIELPYSLLLKNCGIGMDSLTIRSNGNVVPCPPFPDDASLGNVREIPLAEIWNNSVFLNEARSINAFEVSPCRECIHVKVCKGGCMADHYRRTGTLGCSDPFQCAYYTVFDDYIPVEIGDKPSISVEMR
ncbi:MAG: radical SAM protein [Theionarchaea archaeon]|nr:MAG: hypothetical protein AYK19_15905 [Theionarchaea archaeon DG-70-1]MBU7027018.1 radical SAM protein [Theionarchaea archaeon]